MDRKELDNLVQYANKLLNTEPSEDLKSIKYPGRKYSRQPKITTSKKVSFSLFEVYFK